MSQKKNIFPRLEEDNIYRSYALCVREIVFQFFFFFGKQPIENKPYFYMSFLLTIFFMLPNIVKYEKLSL